METKAESSDVPCVVIVLESVGHSTFADSDICGRQVDIVQCRNWSYVPCHTSGIGSECTDNFFHFL